MTKAAISAVAVLAALVFFVLAFAVRDPGTPPPQPAEGAAPAASTPAQAATQADQGFLYGRVTTTDDATYEGRLRWGGDQEAFWNDSFNGVRKENPWAVHLPSTTPQAERRPMEIFGFEIGGKDPSTALPRPFVARFGDIVRIDAQMSVVEVTLKSGSLVVLDRFASGDIDDGVRVWDLRRGTVNLDARRIRAIEFLPTPALAGAPGRMHGTVYTRQGEFTGFILWDRQDCAGDDELTGRAAGSDIALRYDTLRSIARDSRDSARVTLGDGREIVLSNSRDVSHDNRGIYVDDDRYGRVLIAWDTFERVEFSSAGSGPAYSDFLPGRTLVGTVTTRDGRRLTGRLVYDFDESETTDALDAPSQGLDYSVPFSLISAIVTGQAESNGDRRVGVVLSDGREVRLERTGDLGNEHAGMLIFVDGGDEQPEHIAWSDVTRIDFDGHSGARR